MEAYKGTFPFSVSPTPVGSVTKSLWSYVGLMVLSNNFV